MHYMLAQKMKNRYNMHVFPFTFYEMKQYFELNHKEFTDDMFMDYLKWGGFPLRFDYT